MHSWDMPANAWQWPYAHIHTHMRINARFHTLTHINLPGNRSTLWQEIPLEIQSTHRGGRRTWKCAWWFAKLGTAQPATVKQTSCFCPVCDHESALLPELWGRIMDSLCNPHTLKTLFRDTNMSTQQQQLVGQQTSLKPFLSKKKQTTKNASRQFSPASESVCFFSYTATEITQWLSRDREKHMLLLRSHLEAELWKWHRKHDNNPFFTKS